jgi:hypothetical protein
MTDDNYLYVKKKHFYRIMLSVLLFILYAIHGRTTGSNRAEVHCQYFFEFAAMGYCFYIAFLLARLKWSDANRKADEGKGAS